MQVMETCGWLSALCLILCGIPQVIKAVREKHARGLSLSFLVLWTLGEAFGLFYVIYEDSQPLTANYFINLIACIILLIYKIRGERNE